MPKTSLKRSKLIPRKRTRAHTSDDDSFQGSSEAKTSVDGDYSSSRRSRSSTRGSQDGYSRTVVEMKQNLKKVENEKKKLDAKLEEKKEQLKESKKKLDTQTRDIDRMKKEKRKLKLANLELEKHNKEMENTGKKIKKKVETYRAKLNLVEAEKTQLEARVASLQLGQGTSKSSEAGAAGGTGLFQDMMDNFRELAETQLQCVVCSEVFVDAVSINCGHTFCDHCISEWRKKKNNCPVCRTNIKSSNPVMVLDEYSDKVYEQFVSEGGKQARTVLKEERTKLKEAAKSESHRRGQNDPPELLEDISDNSIDSDETLEFRFASETESEDLEDETPTPRRRTRGGGNPSDSDRSPSFETEGPSSGHSSPDSFHNLWRRSILQISSDSEDSTDDDFIIQRWRRQQNRRQLSSSSSSSNSDEESSESSSEDDSG